MSTEEIIRLIFSLIGGGLAVGILNWMRTIRAEKISRRVEHLTNQITKLYGPLFYFTSQNEQLFNLTRKFHGAYDIEYCQTKWSEDQQTQETIREESIKTIDISNKYIEVVQNNNHKVVDIISNNYSFIDIDDIEIFQKFIVDYTRLKTEIDAEGKMVTPIRIYLRIEEISFMRPEFIKRVSLKFNKKLAELKSYQKS
jgi:hypothetical protein